MQTSNNLIAEEIYTWVSAHYQIADWLVGYEHREQELIAILKEIGATEFAAAIIEVDSY